MNLFAMLLGLAAVFLFLPLIVGVPLIYATVRFRKTPIIEPVNLASVESLDYQKIEEITRSLEKANCRAVGDYALSIMAAGKTYSRFFYEESGFISGHVSQVQAQNAAMFVVEFATDFEDGSQLNTRNDSFPSSFTMRKDQVLRQYPRLAADLLLHAHRHSLELMSRGRRPKNIADPDVRRRIAESFERELSQQVRFGLLQGADNSCYRLTTTGAVTMVFKQWAYMMFKYNPTIARDRFVASLGVQRDKAFDNDFKMKRSRTETWKVVFLAMILITGINFVTHPSEKGSVLVFRLAMLFIGVAGLMMLRSRDAKKDRN